MKYVCWHGTPHDFDTFSLNHFGENESQYGDGFYFGSSREIAERYLEDGKGFLIKAEVELNHPVHVNGAANANMRHVMLMGYEKMLELLKRHPDIYNQPDDDAQNPMGDYLSEFWDKEHWTHEELDEMIDELTRDYFNNPSWLHVENFFGKYINEFHKGMKDIFGYDGIVIDWPECDVPCGNRTVHKSAEQFVIAWFPEQVKILQKVRVIPTEEKNVCEEKPKVDDLGRCVFVPKEAMLFYVNEWAKNLFGSHVEAYMHSDDNYGPESTFLSISGLKDADYPAFEKLFGHDKEGYFDPMFEFQNAGTEVELPETVTIGLASDIFKDCGLESVGLIKPCGDGLLLAEKAVPYES